MSDKNDNYLSIKEASRLSSYTTAYLTRLAKKGALEAKREGRFWLIRYESLKDYLSQRDKEEQRRRENLRLQRLEEKEIFKNSSIFHQESVTFTSPVHVLSVSALLQSLVVVSLGVFASFLMQVSVKNDLNVPKIQQGLKEISYSLTEAIQVDRLGQVANLYFYKNNQNDY